MKWLTIDVPARWVDLFVSSVKLAFVAFTVLQIKEWVDAGAFDTPATAVDAVLVAGAILLTNALLKWAKS